MDKHISHYIPLIGMMIVSFVGFFISSFDRSFQISIVIASGVGYVSWGITHHYIHKSLHPEIIIEYLAIAIFGVVSVLLLLFRA